MLTKRIKCAFTAAVSTLISVFLPCEWNTENWRSAPENAETARQIFQKYEADGAGRDRVQLENRLAEPCLQSCRTLQGTPRNLPVVLSSAAFIFRAGKRRIYTLSSPETAFPLLQFLHELLIRMKKDGKKRIFVCVG